MKRLYALRDERAELWYPPFPASNDQDATRAFGGLLSQPETLPNQHPKDFALYFVGTFDENAEIQPIESTQLPTKLWTGDGLLRFHQEVRAGIENLPEATTDE